MTPRLESWDAATSPDQQRLAAYLATVDELLVPVMEQTPDPLGLRLDVGLPGTVDFLHQRDLDNYLLPLARHLARMSSRVFVSVTGSKRHSDSSRIGVGSAVPSDPPEEGEVWQVTTTASAETSAYKEQVHEQLAGARQLPPGPVRLEIVFTVGPSRSWSNLWKPTIDSLGGLLGEGPRRWHPQDGRITELSLHRRVDAAMGSRVELAISAHAVSAR